MLRYQDLEQKFGSHVAYQYLVEIEKAARIRSAEVAALDLETRLAMACQRQDDMLTRQASYAA